MGKNYIKCHVVAKLYLQQAIYQGSQFWQGPWKALTAVMQARSAAGSDYCAQVSCSSEKRETPKLTQKEFIDSGAAS